MKSIKALILLLTQDIPPKRKLTRIVIGVILTLLAAFGIIAYGPNICDPGVNPDCVIFSFVY